MEGTWMLMLWMATAFSCRIIVSVTRSAFLVYIFGPASFPSSYVFPAIGFSRGAYTARALAGMLYKVTTIFSRRVIDQADTTQVGLLPKDNNEQVHFAYKLYTRTDSEGVNLSAGFKRTYSQDVTIEFVGVWYVSLHFIPSKPRLHPTAS